MTLPRAALKLGPDCFGAKFACEGGQVAKVADYLDRLLGPLEWWGADVFHVFPEMRQQCSPTPARLGSTSEFVAWAARVRQFERGVFIATKPAAPGATLPSALASDDDPWRDMGDALAEIRAFDTSYLDIVLADEATASSLASTFGAQVQTASARRLR